MISTLVNMVSSMDHDKTKECLLCEQILAELLPREQEDLGSDFYPNSNYQNAMSSANCFPLYLMQVRQQKILLMWICFIANLRLDNKQLVHTCTCTSIFKLTKSLLCLSRLTSSWSWHSKNKWHHIWHRYMTV